MYTALWKNLDNIKLRERSWIKKATNSMIPFMGNIQNKQIYKWKTK